MVLGQVVISYHYWEELLGRAFSMRLLWFIRDSELKVKVKVIEFEDW